MGLEWIFYQPDNLHALSLVNRSEWTFYELDAQNAKLTYQPDNVEQYFQLLDNNHTLETI